MVSSSLLINHQELKISLKSKRYRPTARLEGCKVESCPRTATFHANLRGKAPSNIFQTVHLSGNCHLAIFQKGTELDQSRLLPWLGSRKLQTGASASAPGWCARNSGTLATKLTVSEIFQQLLQGTPD